MSDANNLNGTKPLKTRVFSIRDFGGPRQMENFGTAIVPKPLLNRRSWHNNFPKSNRKAAEQRAAVAHGETVSWIPKKIPSPGWGGRNAATENFFRPIRGFFLLCILTHG